MNKIVKKAIIPAAGLGTRFLPATKSLPKEMLPILNIPTIQYIVEEAKNAGIEDICIIVSSSKNAIIDHFDSNFELESRLKNKNKMDFYEIVRNIGEGINIYFIRQKEPKGLGHAILQAKTFIGNEPFAVILGDDFVRPEKNKINAIGQCIEAFDKTRNNILGVQKVEKNNIKKYGIVAPKDINPNWNEPVALSGVVEKPDAKDAPSDYAILGRYVFTPKIFSFLEQTKEDKSGEIQLTDAIHSLLSVEPVYAFNFAGTRYDIGSSLGYVIATIDLAIVDPEIKKAVINHIRKLDI